MTSNTSALHGPQGPLGMGRMAFACQAQPDWRVPSDMDCYLLWERYTMPPHIQEHSRMVAGVATAMAERAQELGHAVDVQTVRASALLHDIAKDYTIRHGGSHAQLGAAWVQEIFGNPLISQGIVHHVWWPYDMDVPRYFMTMAVIYADKRVMHTQIVRVRERFLDLIERYGRTEAIREKIEVNLEQSLELESALSEFLEVDLDACAFDSGRLV